MARTSKQEKEADKRRIEALEQAEARAEAEAFDAGWNALPASEQTRLEQQTLATANRIQQGILARGGAFAEATRRTLLKRQLEARAPSRNTEPRRSPIGIPPLPG